MRVAEGDRVYVRGFPFRGHTGTVKEVYRQFLTRQRIVVVKLDEAAAGNKLIRTTPRGVRKVDK